MNAGEEPNTPICLAVQSQNKEMVEFLLQHGVNNVHKALSIARERNLDDIIGLLLEHMTLDRNGDVVNMSGLELQTIKPKWILPSLGVKNSLFVRHRRKRSLGLVTEELMRRKSIGCGEELVLNALRKKFSAESSGGIDEPDLGTEGNHQSGNGTPSRKRSSSSSVLSDSISSLRRSSAGNIRFARSNRSFADSSSIAEQLQSPSENRDPVCVSKPHSDVDASAMATELEERLTELITPVSTPSKPTPKRKYTPAFPVGSFEPSLPTIHGTPNATMDRRILQEDSGMSPHSRFHGEDDSDSNSSTQETSSRQQTPRRRHERKSTVTGARGLPFYHAHQYKKKEAEERFKSPTSENEGFSISPTLLFQRLKRWRQDRRKKRLSLSSAASLASSRPESPVPVVYSRSDYGYYGSDQEDQFSNPTSPRSSGDELTSPRHWFSPESSTYVMDDDSRGTTPREVNQSLQLSLKERTPSSTDSSCLYTPIMDSRRSSIDIALLQRLQERDEVDWGGFKAIPETVEVSSRLVKVLDVSSNQISSFSELAEGGDVVFQRLRGLERVDMKQNDLSKLPEILMQVWQLKCLSVCMYVCLPVYVCLSVCSSLLLSVNLATYT